jgi:hypothetical protein
VSAPTVKIAVVCPPFPGARFAPVLTIARPSTVPVSRSVVRSLSTMTSPEPVPEPDVLLTSSVPPFTAVPLL